MILYKKKGILTNQYMELCATSLIKAMQMRSTMSYQVIMIETKTTKQNKAYIQLQLEIKENQV